MGAEKSGRGREEGGWQEEKRGKKKEVQDGRRNEKRKLAMGSKGEKERRGKMEERRR